uniref:protein-serine/threonine phosphatase n=1 Tax=Oryza rufipogon TaxID=4529 RepID=A0A0E0Q5S8_ORYRU
MPPASIPTSCKSGEVDFGVEEVGGVEELANLESARRRSGVCRWRRLQYEATSASFLPMGGRFDERAARPVLLFTDLLVYILVNSDELMNQGIQDINYVIQIPQKSCIPGSAVTEAVAVMKWESLLPNDTFLIVASSDGAFEKMTMQDVCDLMLYVKLGVKQELGSFAVTQQNLADYIGTTDNVAAVIVPLGSHYSSKVTLKDCVARFA